ncbi:MAG: hypothetical protein H3C59_10750 [Burkholderiaceae bacterium]|nr:hypothetical protein [Burkholderiaceae bacterium]
MARRARGRILNPHVSNRILLTGAIAEEIRLLFESGSSTSGVTLTGAGLALLFADRLAPFTVLILSSGLVIHAVAMFGKRRILSDRPRNEDR